MKGIIPILPINQKQFFSTTVTFSLAAIAIGCMAQLSVATDYHIRQNFVHDVWLKLLVVIKKDRDMQIIGWDISQPEITVTSPTIMPCISLVGASLSEPHIDETNVCNPI